MTTENSGYKGNTEWLNWDLETVRQFIKEYNNRPVISRCALCKELGHMHPNTCDRNGELP